MNKIEQYLKLASDAYYSGKPFLSDDVFDRLAESIGFNEVGAKQHEHLVKHYKQLYSLDKYYEGEGKRPLADISVNALVKTPKLDGACIEILYINGELALVATRGDGVEGTNITDKFQGSHLIPQTINLNGVVQITGEIVAPKQVENARNYAAGSLNLKSVNEFRTRAVNFYAYGVYPYITDTFTGDMQELSRLGFETVFANDLHNIYPCDGIVVRVDNNAHFESLGYTAKFPRGAFAIKERSEAVETKLLDVVWQVGKSGKVTPVAILEPVMIGDAVVSKATLNNPGFIEMLDLHIGDTVGVIRSGEIIPTITHKVDA